MEFVRETRKTEGKRYVEMEYINSKGEVLVYDNRKRTGKRGAVPKTHPDFPDYKLSKVITYLPDDMKEAYKEVIAVVSPVSPSPSLSPIASSIASAMAPKVIAPDTLDIKAQNREKRRAERLAKLEQDKLDKKALKASVKLARQNAKSTSASAMDADVLLMSKYTLVTDINVISSLPVGAVLSLPNTAFDGVAAFKFRVDATYAGIEGDKVYCLTEVNDRMARLPNRHGFFVPIDGKYKVKPLSGKVV